MHLTLKLEINDPQTIVLTTDKNGEVSFTPKQAGRYMLFVEYEADIEDYALADSIEVDYFSRLKQF